jgi:2,4-dienoyl-CoA reductase-like NADH-dependent reductase (Old Yellow Enzyme family)
VDFIFMLTRDDKTVPDCFEVLEAVVPHGVRHIGFKDAGADKATMARLATAIRKSGAASYLEVVSLEPEAGVEAACLAAEIGVDCLMGGTDIAGMKAALGNAPVAFLPFVGKPSGHPTVLGGTAEEVAADCRRARELGCAGVDLLAYRSNAADPLSLVRAARGALGEGRLVVAGSIDTPARVRAIAEAGADAFTVGTAVLDRRFAPGLDAIEDQLYAIQAAYV